MKAFGLRKPIVLIAMALAAVLFRPVSGQANAVEKRPNVLLIIVDDLNDWIGPLGGHPQSLTPNLDRLASSGITFTNAHCSAPACNPSRVSLMTGTRPSTTGIYENKSDWKRALPNALILPQLFREAGYTVMAVGKIIKGLGSAPVERPGKNKEGTFEKATRTPQPARTAAEGQGAAIT